MPELLTLSAYVASLPPERRISRRRVLALIHSGQLPAVRYGRDWLIAAGTPLPPPKTGGWPRGRRRKPDSGPTSDLAARPPRPTQ